MNLRLVRKISVNAPNAKNFMWIGIILCLIFVIVGIILLVVRNNEKKRCTEPVTALIIENQTVVSTSRSHGHVHKSTSYAPVFQYTYNGQEYKIKSNTSSNPPVFTEGEQTEIFINPLDPADIYVPKDKTIIIISAVFIAIGTIGAICIAFAMTKIK